MMDKRFFLFFSCVFVFINVFASINDAAQINLEHRDKHDNHFEYYPPADMPEAYYNSNMQAIIIVADGFASYYDVDIISQSTQLAVISTQIDGYGDTIDVSSLPDDDYIICITSSNNNEFVGYFSNY